MSKVHRVREIHVSFEAAARVLATRAKAVVAGEGDVTSFGTRMLGLHVEHEVMLHLGPFDVVDTTPVHVGTLPFRVEAAEHPELFPVLEGDLELTSADTIVELALEGTYRVPGGVVGALADRGVMHHVADESIDEFFDGIVRRLRSEAGSVDAMTGVPV